MMERRFAAATTLVVAGAYVGQSGAPSFVDEQADQHKAPPNAAIVAVASANDTGGDIIMYPLMGPEIRIRRHGDMPGAGEIAPPTDTG